MKKTLFPILIIAAILLTACSSTKDTTQTGSPTATAIVEEQDTVNSAADTTKPFTSLNEPCKPINIIELFLGAPTAGLPPVTDDDWVVGPDDAVVTLIEYSQLTCPACVVFEPQILEFQKQFPEDVRLIYRHFLFQDKSILAAQALEAAGNQGKFIEFKNYMFDRRARNAENPEHVDLPDDAFWASVSEDDFDEWLESHVGELGIEPIQFLKDMFSSEIVDKIQTASVSANGLGLGGTPSLFINNRLWKPSRWDFGELAAYVKLIKNQEKEYDSCPPMVIHSDKMYSAKISTTKGDFIVDLFADSAPYTVNTFIFLAQEGWYDGLPIISTNEFVLSGDPSDTGYGGPGYAYLDEIDPDRTLNDAGYLASFSLSPGINGSAFFINKTVIESTQSRTIFGEVTQGMDVVNALELRENIFDPVIDRILSVTIIEK